MVDKISDELRAVLDTHPCYSEKAHTKFARMHLPVAPRCNIQCNYCNRKYDCTNESRPGVTSELLTAEQAVEKIRYVKQKIPYLSVIGIAGPGDPLANEETFRTLELVGKEFPELTLCLSTNGLILPASVDRLKKLGIKFITVTMNAIDPKVGAKMYDFVIFEGKTLRGEEAAAKLIEKQIEGIRKAVAAGMLVKVNTVMVAGINDDHIPEVAKKVKELGAYVVNIIPMIPVPGTKFAELKAPTAEQRKKLQDLCEPDIKQMRHCRFCRADAIGLLGEDRSAEFAHYSCQARDLPVKGPVQVQMPGDTVYKVAVASLTGENVDLHFGQAKRFQVFQVEGDKITEIGPLVVEQVPNVALSGDSHKGKLEMLAELLRGCDVVISMSIGTPAKEYLKEEGIRSYTAKGPVRTAVKESVDALFQDRANTFE
jgi:nitrogen fixation protein NifB